MLKALRCLCTVENFQSPSLFRFGGFFLTNMETTMKLASLVNKALMAVSLIILTSCNNLQGYNLHQDSINQTLAEHRANTLPSGWNVRCNIDSLTDKKQCFMAKFFASCNGCSKEHSIRVEKTQNGSTLLSFGLNDNTGTSATVRIDKNKAERYSGTNVKGSQASKLIKQMKRGNKGIAEYWTWPDDHNKYSFNLDGFSEAYNLLLKKFNSK